MSPWKEFLKSKNLSLLGLKETLEGGQTFSWSSKSTNSWIGCINSKIVELKFENEMLFWRTSNQHAVSESEIKKYFWLDKTYDQAVKELPTLSDPVLNKCVHALPGLTILKQPLDETLFYFILSSAKSIPQIKETGLLVCKNWGKALGHNLWSFPGWSKLADVPESELRILKLGYRAKYVAKTARFISDHQGWLESIPKRTYDDAKTELLRLPGVGEKVADCVLLFGGNFLQAFPVDTWIEKSLDRRYSLADWKTNQKIHFARIHFGRFAGLAQQFLFSAERLGILDKS